LNLRGPEANPTPFLDSPDSFSGLSKLTHQVKEAELSPHYLVSHYHSVTVTFLLDFGLAGYVSEQKQAFSPLVVASECRLIVVYPW